jgi:hypothetical protein
LGLPLPSCTVRRSFDTLGTSPKEALKDLALPCRFWAGFMLWGVFAFISMANGGTHQLSPDQVVVELEPRGR